MKKVIVLMLVAFIPLMVDAGNNTKVKKKKGYVHKCPKPKDIKLAKYF